MNYPPIFAAANASSEVRALLGTPLRFFLFGRAPQNVQKPYAVWQTIYGTPDNYINQVPDGDQWGAQVDVYAVNDIGGVDLCRSIAQALQEAIEPVAYVTGYNGEFKEADTNLWRYSFTTEWRTHRT